MKETKEFKGLWWLPDTPDKQIPGTLIVEKSKTTLETIGVLGLDNPLMHIIGRSVSQHEVIWGISSQAQEISVFNCSESISLNTDCPFALAKYDIQVVAVGKHIRSLDELGNYDVKAYITELSYWFRPDCLYATFDYNEHKFTCCADDKNSHYITIPLDNTCDLKIEGEAHFSQNKTGLQVNFEQESTLNFLFSKLISIHEAEQKVFLFEQFLSFATLAPVQSDRLLLIDKDKKADPTQNSSIEIIFNTEENKINHPERFWNYLFVYDTIKDTFPSIISRWYSEKEMSPIRAHLIDSVGHRGIFGSSDFLVVAQAVDGFYCRFRKDLGLFDALKRLKEEFKDISIIEMSDNDINCICDSRNYYSHLLPTGKKKNVIIDGTKLYYLTHKLRKILLCCMLNFVGFSNDEINKIFKKSNNSYLRMIDKKS